MQQIPQPEVALQTIQASDAELLRRMSQVEIRNTDDQHLHESNLILARKAYARTDETRKTLIAPLNEGIKRINALFNPYLSKLKLGIDTTNFALGKWRTDQSEYANKQLDTVAKDYVDKLNESKITGEKVEPPILPTLTQPKTSYTGPGSVTYMDGFKITVINEDAVPRDLCKPDMVKIRSRIKSGVKQINGVLITKQFNTRTSTK